MIEALRQRARALGFDAVGVADAAAPWDCGDRLAEFLALGRHGEMAWMATHAARRSHPTALWPEAQSAVMVGASYAPPFDPRTLLGAPDRAAIATYALRRDYHDVIKGRLKDLGQWLAQETRGDVKVFVDTAPLLEKPLAARAGLGWQGKHTNLVSREHGSWLLLGAVLTAARLEPDAPETDHCGVCRACLDVCPTQAFPAPYQLDARRCIAYLTIEHAGPIPTDFRAAIGNRVFGCDDCLAVCPWNKFAAAAHDQTQSLKNGSLGLKDGLAGAPLAALAALDDAAFRTLFAGTPVKRTGRDRFVRNVLIALGNARGPAEAIIAALGDPSPLVRGAAVWAARQALDPERFARLKTERAPHEGDAVVRSEWEGLP